MPVAYSQDLRSRVIAAWKAQEGSQRQLAERFKVSLSFVHRVLDRYRAEGQIEAKPRGATMQPKISDAALEVLQKLVEEHKDALLVELCEYFAQQTGIRVSVPTMHRALQRLRLRRKKKDAVCE